MCAGQREVPSPPPSEQPPPSLLLLELSLDDRLAVRRQEAQRALRPRAQEAAPARGAARPRPCARPRRRQLEHVEEAGRAELVQ